MTQVIQNVSDTAFMVAGFRAAENERPNPLFRDPLAARLAGEHGGEILATMPYSVVGAWSVVIRTVIIDELITRAIGEGVDTVLNLGAGTRYATLPHGATGRSPLGGGGLSACDRVQRGAGLPKRRRVAG